MYYFLGYKLISMKIPRKRKKVISENTFLLALDGDVDFQPSAVQLLVDRMKKNPSLGATCGRIHPIGSGRDTNNRNNAFLFLSVAVNIL